VLNQRVMLQLRQARVASIEAFHFSATSKLKTNEIPGNRRERERERERERGDSISIAAIPGGYVSPRISPNCDRLKRMYAHYDRYGFPGGNAVVLCASDVSHAP
jgi:hypothetical protein